MTTKNPFHRKKSDNNNNNNSKNNPANLSLNGALTSPTPYGSDKQAPPLKLSPPFKSPGFKPTDITQYLKNASQNGLTVKASEKGQVVSHVDEDTNTKHYQADQSRQMVAGGETSSTQVGQNGEQITHHQRVIGGIQEIKSATRTETIHPPTFAQPGSGSAGSFNGPSDGGKLTASTTKTVENKTTKLVTKRTTQQVQKKVIVSGSGGNPGSIERMESTNFSRGDANGVPPFAGNAQMIRNGSTVSCPSANGGVGRMPPFGEDNDSFSTRFSTSRSSQQSSTSTSNSTNQRESSLSPPCPADPPKKAPSPSLMDGVKRRILSPISGGGSLPDTAVTPTNENAANFPGGSGSANVRSSSSATTRTVKSTVSRVSMISSMDGSGSSEGGTARTSFISSNQSDGGFSSSGDGMGFAMGGPGGGQRASTNRSMDDEIDAVLQLMEDNFRSMLDAKRNEFLKLFPQLARTRAHQAQPPAIAPKPSHLQSPGAINGYPARTVPHTNGVMERPGGQRGMLSSPPAGFGSAMRSETKLYSWNNQYEARPGQEPVMYGTRAFLEYLGPNLGYKYNVEAIPLMHGSEYPSEDEEEPDDMEADSVSHGSRMSTVSEIPDHRNAMVTYQPKGPPKIEPADKRRDRSEKAFCAAEELVKTEESYVEKLHLLDQVFRHIVEVDNASSNFMSKKEINAIFSNLESLYKFHSQHLLPALQKKLTNWPETQQICDVVSKNAPFLKIYSEYANNYKNATRVFAELYGRNKKFMSIVDSIQATKECDNLPLSTHLICPVQRVMRYNLLLQEYLKNLPPNHHDRKDCEKSIDLVSEAANHANDLMKKMDQYKYVLEIQEQLGNAISIVTASRQLIFSGELTRISSQNNDQHLRQLFLFNDMVLVCSQPLISIAKKQLKLRNLLSLDGMKVLEGDNLEVENSFYIKTADKCLEFFAKSQQEKQKWQQAFWETLKEFEQAQSSLKREESMSGSASTSSTDQSGSPGQCSVCNQAFKSDKQRLRCENCNIWLCKKCRSEKLSSEDGKQSLRVCQECSLAATKDRRKSSLFTSWGRKKNRPLSMPSMPADRSERDKLTVAATTVQRTKSLLNVRPNDKSLLAEYLQLRVKKDKDWTRRYFAVHEDYILYTFKSNKDQCAMTSLPLPGCSAHPCDHKTDPWVKADELVFKIVTPRSRCYYLRAETKESLVQWITLINMVAVAELPSESESSDTTV